MRILITGFDPFGGEAVNPAWESVRLLPDEIAGAQVIKQQLPTVFGKAGNVLASAIERYAPDAVICVGQAGGRKAVTVERIAINLRDTGGCDNEGNQPVDAPIVCGGPVAYFSTLPVKAIAAGIKERGIAAGLSNSAGLFVCNDVMYTLLHLFPTIPGGFIHVPFSTDQLAGKPEGTPAMELSTISEALAAAIEVVAKSLE